MIDSDSCLLMGDLFGLIEQITGHHAAIGDHDRELGFAIIQDETTCVESIVDLVGLCGEKATVDDHGKFQRRNIDRSRACTKRGGMQVCVWHQSEAERKQETRQQ
jgi:hypothetical protein